MATIAVGIDQTLHAAVAGAELAIARAVLRLAALGAEIALRLKQVEGAAFIQVAAAQERAAAEEQGRRSCGPQRATPHGGAAPAT